MVRAGAFLVFLAVLRVEAAFSPKFQDVSTARGILSYGQMHKRKPYKNKYWGSSIADVNRDGDFDIFVSNHGNNPEYYLSTGTGQFKSLDPKRYFTDVHSSCVADMDNDGYLDIVVTHGGSRGNNVTGTPIVHRGNTTPVEFNQGVGSSLGLGGIPMRGRSSSFVDMNADGFPELLLLNKRNLSAVTAHILYENRGNGKFVARRDFGIEGIEADKFILIDANEDSYMDILIIGFISVQLWLGNRGFRFRNASHLIPRNTDLSLVTAVAELDYDKDGDMDLILVRGATRGIRSIILLEKTPGGYVWVGPAKSKLPSGNHFHITVGDLDNDGFPDLYISRVTSFESPRLNDYVLMNNGNKTFSVASNTGTETAGTDTDGDNGAIFDFDADGRADLLVGSRNSAWKLYRNITPRGINHFVHVRVGSPRAGLTAPYWFRRNSMGALVKVFCGGEIFLARVGSPGQSHSQSYMETLHFGLGECTSLERIEVHYVGQVVVTRSSGLSVDGLIEIGLYFPCPSGFTGRDCDRPILPCTSSPCSSTEVCDTAKLIDEQCDRQRCTGGSSTELLTNGNFEADSAWVFIGSALYTNKIFFMGIRSVHFPTGYARARQDVVLKKNQQYILSCVIRDGPVQFKIRRYNKLFAEDNGENVDTIPGSTWKLFTFEFTTTGEGLHRVLAETAIGVNGYIDRCSLKSQGCSDNCLQLFCPV